MLSDSYGGGNHRKKRPSWSQIQKMKRNMQKVPGIQQESAAYHQEEASKAEKMLEDAIVQQSPYEKQKNARYKTKHTTIQSTSQQSRLYRWWHAIQSFLGR